MFDPTEIAGRRSLIRSRVIALRDVRVSPATLGLAALSNWLRPAQACLQSSAGGVVLAAMVIASASASQPVT